MGCLEWERDDPLLFFAITSCTVCLLMWTCPLFADPHAFQRHFNLINKGDLETILRAVVFVNEAYNQVRAAHKILWYDPI